MHLQWSVMLQNLGGGSNKKTKLGPVQIFFYDTRRGNNEGHEEGKILSFYPSSTSSDDQLVLVGLSQALTTFISTFDEDVEDQCLETDNRRWCSKKFEVGVWLGAVADADWGPGKIGRSALNVLLSGIYGWVKLLYGSVNSLLDEDPSRSTARTKLQSVLNSWGDILTAPKSKVKKSLQSPLAVARFGAIPFLPLSREALLSVQYVCAALHDAHNAVGVCFCYETYILWSTLDLEGTKLAYSLAEMSNMLGTKRAVRQPQKIQMGARGSTRKMWLVPIQNGPLTTLVLMEFSDSESGKLLAQLRVTVAARTDRICSGASYQLLNLDAFHISGYRYVYLDLTSQFGCSSPAVKVKHLSKKTLLLLQHVQNIFRIGERDAEEDCEIVVRGDNKGWVAIREGGSRVLCVALDQLPDASMDQIHDHIAKLCDTNFPGAFDM